MNNLSDGTKDGFAIFYLKGGKLCTVLLDKEQIEMLDLSLSIAFGNDDGKKIRIAKPDKETMLKLL